MGVPETDPLSKLSLPPGFRFFPTDEELLVQYLCPKVAGHHFSLEIIGDIDLYKFDPWDLPSKAVFGEKEWYFFSPRDRKYPNGSRPNRVAGTGYWKATGTDKIITNDGRKAGIKKALVFYVGKAPKGTKTNWIMHEYRLLESTRKNGSTKLDDWVLCRIYKKNSSSQKPVLVVPNKEHNWSGSPTSSSSQLEDMLDLPEIEDRCFDLPRVSSLRAILNEDNKMGFQNSTLDWASLATLNSVPELAPCGQTQSHNQVVPSYGNNDMYIPSLQPQQFSHVQNRVGNSVEDEAQSWIRTHRVGSDSGVTWSQNFSNSVDPFGFRYPTQSGGFGFRQ